MHAGISLMLLKENDKIPSSDLEEDMAVYFQRRCNQGLEAKVILITAKPNV